jgi:hypothetical protein
MRCGAAWSDVCIVNLSTRGVGLQSPRAPDRGTYVELRRGSNVLIVGCVVWSEGQRFGVRTQDPIWIDGVLRASGGQQASAAEWRDRRAMPRAQRGAGWSAIRGRMMQFGFLVAGGVAATALLGSLVDSALANPLNTISTILADSAPG